MPDTEYCTVAEAAGILGVAERTVRHYIRQGKLTGYKRLGRVVLRREEVIALGEVKPRQPRPPAPDQQP